MLSNIGRVMMRALSFIITRLSSFLIAFQMGRMHEQVQQYNKQSKTILRQRNMAIRHRRNSVAQRLHDRTF